MKILPILITLVLLVGSFVAVSNISKNNDVRSHAFDTPTQNNGINNPALAGKPATISNVQLTHEGTTIVVSWNTSLPASSYVEYGLDKEQLGHTAHASGDNTFTHSVKIAPLDTVRHYVRIRATGINGKEAISSVYNYMP